jgi:2-polyprenyl-6-methoxyphenol hydroxylase-like FAD-dependent oxidoreductase
VTAVHASTCVVGGGPAGLMLGLLFAKRGADVLVLEGHETLPPLDPAFTFRAP